MMKKLNLLLLATLLAGTTSVMAATEVSKAETSKLKLVKTITVTEDTVNSCMDKISKAADSNGAEYFYIKGLNTVGNGGQAVVTGELYNK